MYFKSKNAEETINLAKKIVKFFQPDDIIFLNGDLGSGKTTFVKGFAKGLNITENVTSPTFNLLKVYQNATIPLVHVDAYRLENSSLDELDDYMSTGNIIIIEWGEYLKNIFSFFKEYLVINIDYVSKNVRKYHFIPVGTKYEILLEKLVKEGVICV